MLIHLLQNAALKAVVGHTSEVQSSIVQIFGLRNPTVLYEEQLMVIIFNHYRSQAKISICCNVLSLGLPQEDICQMSGV